MTTMPLHSLEQRHAALKKANSRRSMRSQRKKLWKCGTVAEARADLADLLEDPPAWAATWKVWFCLLAQPMVGEVRASVIMRRVGISHAKTLGGLTDRQRRELMAKLVEREEPLALNPKSPTLCPGCGEVKSDTGLRCRSCYYEELRVRREERRRCPDCGGRKKRESKRCAFCAPRARYGTR